MVKLKSFLWPQQISEHLETWTWKLSYYYGLVMGLLPAPFNWKHQQFEQSRSYLWYSAIMQIVMISLSPMGTPLFANEANYMHGKMVLQWTYYIGKGARILTNLVLSLETWLQRKQILDLYESYREYLKKYEKFRQFYNVNDEMQHEIKTVKYYTIYKLCTSHANALIISGLFLKMQNRPSPAYILMILINFIQSFYLLQVNIQFFVIISRIHLHFVYINKSLELLSSGTTHHSPIVFLRFWILYSMHYECYLLARRILAISRKATLVTLIKIFTTNVVLLYHAVQFANGNIESDEIGNFVGVLCIVIFYCDAMLTMICVDNILSSCNRAGELLSLRPVLKGETKSFSKMVSFQNIV